MDIAVERVPSREELVTEQVRLRSVARGRRLLKSGVWLYFLLLIFEGALRKWGIPALAAPLLIVRDPVAIWMLYIAWKYNELPKNVYIWGMFFIGIIAFFSALLTGHGKLAVAVYGERILVLQFPIIFLIGRVFDRTDVIKMAKALIWISIPMAFIITLQFYSPQSSLINRGVGGDTAGSGFSGALGYFRPSGTFSFTTGNSQFFGFVSVLVIYFWLSSSQINKILLIVATITLIAAIPLSISRTLVFQVTLSSVYAGLSIIRNPKYLSRFIVAAAGLVLLMAVLSQVSFLATATNALTTRFSNASDSEGTIGDTLSGRLLGGINEPFQAADFPFFGYGIGMGTNAGAKLLVGSADQFLIAEGEWGRLVGEMGAILGGFAIFIRIAAGIKLTKEVYKKLLMRDLLPWMLLSISLQALAQGQWAQPTALGFSVLTAGLTIAALRTPVGEAQPDID
jgi:hypothetical protein